MSDRRFEAKPAVPPTGPLPDPPKIVTRHATPSPTPIDPGPQPPPPPPILKMEGRQLTVRRLLELLQEAVSGDPHIADYAVESEGCDCTGASFGIQIDKQLREVLVAREIRR